MGRRQPTTALRRKRVRRRDNNWLVINAMTAASVWEDNHKECKNKQRRLMSGMEPLHRRYSRRNMPRRGRGAVGVKMLSRIRSRPLSLPLVSAVTPVN